jgi:hypothetical protein
MTLPSEREFKDACAAAGAIHKPWRQSKYVLSTIGKYEHLRGVCLALSIVFLHKNLLNQELTDEGATDLKRVVVPVTKKPSKVARFFCCCCCVAEAAPIPIVAADPDPARLTATPALGRAYDTNKRVFEARSFMQALYTEGVIDLVDKLQTKENDRIRFIEACQKLLKNDRHTRVFALYCVLLHSVRKSMEEQFGAALDPEDTFPFPLPSGHEGSDKAPQILGQIADCLGPKGVYYVLMLVPGHAVAAVVRPNLFKFFDPNHGQAVCKGDPVSALKSFTSAFFKGDNADPHFILYVPNFGKRHPMRRNAVLRMLAGSEEALPWKFNPLEECWATISETYEVMVKAVEKDSIIEKTS